MRLLVHSCALDLDQYFTSGFVQAKLTSSELEQPTQAQSRFSADR